MKNSYWFFVVILPIVTFCDYIVSLFVTLCSHVLLRKRHKWSQGVTRCHNLSLFALLYYALLCFTNKTLDTNEHRMFNSQLCIWCL